MSPPVMATLGMCMNSGNFDKSIETHLKAMQIREKLFGTSGSEVTQSYFHLGRVYREKKEYTTSLAYFGKALQNKLEKYGPEHKELVSVYDSISEVYFMMGNKVQGDFYKGKAEESSKH